MPIHMPISVWSQSAPIKSGPPTVIAALIDRPVGHVAGAQESSVRSQIEGRHGA
ncbi:hypothetical protein [Gordonia paraffinivorans]|uniref:hypothetical protein n=1 Tax=Gordonia paraffinivorans TaxID=175628 RepID=UPI00242F428F|nr:hypothetical protein [Gordonia paraffinivorans]